MHEMSRCDRRHFMKVLDEYLDRSPARRNVWRIIVLLQLLGLTADDIQHRLTSREYAVIQELGGFDGEKTG